MTTERLTRTPEELAEVRRQAHARLAHAEVVAAAQRRLAPDTPCATFYCEEPHPGGRTRKLGEAALLGPEILFVSRIQWLPSDLLNLRPWEREQLLGSGWNDGLDSNDRRLSDWLDRLDEWEKGVTPTGPRALMGKGPHGIAVVLTPGMEPVLTPWVRCPDHPTRARVVTVSELMAAWRAS